MLYFLLYCMLNREYEYQEYLYIFMKSKKLELYVLKVIFFKFVFVMLNNILQINVKNI